MKRYIIKNCPALYNCDVVDNWCNDLTNSEDCSCENYSNCLLKQIVELCDSNVSKVLYEGETSKLKFIEGNPLAKKILKMLEIEEVDE